MYAISQCDSESGLRRAPEISQKVEHVRADTGLNCTVRSDCQPRYVKIVQVWGLSLILSSRVLEADTDGTEQCQSDVMYTCPPQYLQSSHVV